MSYAERALSITVSGAPAWFSALPDKTWTRVATGGAGGATIYEVKPSGTFGGSINPGLFAFSGACVDQTRGELLVHGGGHSDYSGNEVYALSLRASTPAWVRLVDPSPGVADVGSPPAGGPGQYNGDVGLNGWPAANHTSNNLLFANGRMWLPRVWGMYPSTWGTPRIFWLDRERLRWTAGPKWRTDAELAYGGAYESYPSFYIAVDDAIITGSTQDSGHGIANQVKIDARTGAILARWTDNDLYYVGVMQSAKAVVLPGTRLAVLIHPYSGGATVQVWDYTSSPPTLSTPALVDSTGGLAGWKSEVTGAVYHAASGAILCGAGGGEYIAAIPVPTNPKTGTWTAQRITPANVASGSRIVPPSASYVYGRFNLIENMGDGRSALVYLPSDATAATYVMALPTTGVF